MSSSVLAVLSRLCSSLARSDLSCLTSSLIWSFLASRSPFAASRSLIFATFFAMLWFRDSFSLFSSTLFSRYPSTRLSSSDFCCSKSETLACLFARVSCRAPMSDLSELICSSYTIALVTSSILVCSMS